MTPIDTLYYQWAVDEDKKKTPTIFEDIQNIEIGDKVNELLGVHADLVADVLECEVAHRAILDDYIVRAQDDPELSEATNDELAEAISEIEEVKEGETAVSAATTALDMFHDNFVTVLAGVE